MLKDWWTTESFGAKYERSVSQSKEDRRAQELLESTTTKLTGNRYQTGLLWKTDDTTPFPDSKVMATKRLHGTERRLVNDQEKAAAYQATIDAYVKKGHARKLSREEARLRLPRRWFLPHHAVTNPNKPGRFRMVFDAAARSQETSLRQTPDRTRPAEEPHRRPAPFPRRMGWHGSRHPRNVPPCPCHREGPTCAQLPVTRPGSN